MNITDINGYNIEVTNLDEALKIADEYRQYSHENIRYSALDAQLKTYWTDMFLKLSQLKNVSIIKPNHHE
jgi:hypothetical protein